MCYVLPVVVRPPSRAAMRVPPFRLVKRSRLRALGSLGWVHFVQSVRLKSYVLVHSQLQVEERLHA